MYFAGNDNKCTGSHPVDGPWYQQTIPQWFYFLVCELYIVQTATSADTAYQAVPGFPLCLSLRNHAKPNKELLVMVLSRFIHSALACNLLIHMLYLVILIVAGCG